MACPPLGDNVFATGAEILRYINAMERRSVSVMMNASERNLPPFLAGLEPVIDIRPFGE
jgi:hypothetical protein